MKVTKGYNMNFDIKNLIKVSDLIFFDGPLLSHYISQRGENYLFYWVDVDDIANRWLIIRTDIFTIQEYLDKKITLYDVTSSRYSSSSPMNAANCFQLSLSFSAL